MKPIFLIITFSCLLISCAEQSRKVYPGPELDLSKTFTEVSSDYSGITFNNKLEANRLKSPLQFVNVFNGGGVAVGDVNNDGLTDIFFTGNSAENKLYLNKGGFKFEDITQKAGVASPNSWCTGATIIDVNNDGLKDIYVCRSYYDDASRRENQLYINNGDDTFTDQAAAYGVNDSGYSIVASFFDFDKDGNLDVFVGNHPKEKLLTYAQHYENWSNPTEDFSNRLYRNLGGQKYKDVTVSSGLLSYGWTLGTVTVDLNNDNWPDIYVTVDHDEPDRFYINNQNGTFREASLNSLKHISFSSMGVDAGDINNDGFLDLVTVEMLSEDNYRSKTQMQNMDVDRFWNYVRQGYNYQYMRNMLHVNNGNGTFREVGQMAKIHKTDWSWASLFMDMDNDGWQDLYVSNGYFKDYSDQDYRISYNDKIKEADETGNVNQKLKLLTEHGKDAKSTRLENYAFLNNGDYTFKDVSEETGLNFKGFSNGAAYADFDNDGDLDLVTSNINDIASLYANNSVDKEGSNNWLRIRLSSENSSLTYGTKVTLTTDQGSQYREHTLTRGYQSAVEDALHFGLANVQTVDKIEIIWSDGMSQILNDVDVNQELVVEKRKAKERYVAKQSEGKLFREVIGRRGLAYNHKEKYYDDYEVQVLLPHQMSCFGPAMAKADINNDGNLDIYFGGAQDQPAHMYVQDDQGSFIKVNFPFLIEDQQHEDLAATFFDADGDGDQDLYVVSGGNEKPLNNHYYQDRFYLNNGRGGFQKAQNRIPKMVSSGSCVKSFDFDQDGDLDLFVGSRHIPGKYPFAPKSYLLENQGGTFIDVTSKKAKSLLDLGMVTDAIWTDLNNDNSVDLLVVGEWMPVTFLIQEEGGFENKTEAFGMSKTQGWWNTIHKVDVDEDGDGDFVLGNLGLNYKYKASPTKPFHIYAGDFDSNGSSDIVLSYLNNEVLLPVRGKQCSTEQMPGLAKKFDTYDAFGKASLNEIYGDKLDNALHYSARVFESSILQNDGGSYVLKSLPQEAQSSPVNGIVSRDFDGDGHVDLLMAGNMHVAEVETGRSDAGIGFFLKGDGEGGFETKFANETGFFARGDVKKLEYLKSSANEEFVLVVRNNGDLTVMQL